MNVVNPDIRDLQQEFTELRDRMSKAEGKLEQLQRTASDTSRQTIWQFVIFTVTMAGVLAGMTVYQTEALRRETVYQTEAVRRETDARFASIEKRMDQMEKNLTARFDDLKQIVLANRKQPAQSDRSNGRK
ncbi:MAG: hypothetical protein J2P41_09975 [Blastocatellia bacterium]|nr:hypothetical protein [Blastocatellia bacterium]